MGEISPLRKDMMPQLYNDPVQPSTKNQPQYETVTADGRTIHAELGEEEEVEVFDEEPEVVHIDSEIHSELDLDHDGVDYEQEEVGTNEELNTAQIKLDSRCFYFRIS